jgi:hypothetical protein
MILSICLVLSVIINLALLRAVINALKKVEIYEEFTELMLARVSGVIEERYLRGSFVAGR